jgi:hypothetical protein
LEEIRCDSLPYFRFVTGATEGSEQDMYWANVHRRNVSDGDDWLLAAYSDQNVARFFMIDVATNEVPILPKVTNIGLHYKYL